MTTTQYHIEPVAVEVLSSDSVPDIKDKIHKKEELSPYQRPILVSTLVYDFKDCGQQLERQIPEVKVFFIDWSLIPKHKSKASMQIHVMQVDS